MQLKDQETKKSSHPAPGVYLTWQQASMPWHHSERPRPPQAAKELPSQPSIGVYGLCFQWRLWCPALLLPEPVMV